MCDCMYVCICLFVSFFLCNAILTGRSCSNFKECWCRLCWWRRTYSEGERLSLQVAQYCHLVSLLQVTQHCHLVSILQVIQHCHLVSLLQVTQHCHLVSLLQVTQHCHLVSILQVTQHCHLVSILRSHNTAITLISPPTHPIHKCH